MTDTCTFNIAPGRFNIGNIDTDVSKVFRVLKVSGMLNEEKFCTIMLLLGVALNMLKEVCIKLVLD